MKKKILYSTFAMLMCFCLLLTGCENTGENGDVENNENTTNQTTNIKNNNPYFIRKENGKYIYKLENYEIPIKTNLNKYVDEDNKIFHYTNLGYDLGWHAFWGTYSDPQIEASYKADPDLVNFYRGEGQDFYAGHSTLTRVHTRYRFVYGSKRRSTHILTFSRFDVGNEDVSTYTSNKGGHNSVNMAQIIIITYVLENQINNDENCLEAIQMGDVNQINL